ncbi:MAG TPA: sulfatase-like hydrolase/transferase, partial [Luteolibacter sp.]|nr:sulfatase-like hydrolase/transferase [Luteolibacter sp.]
YFTAALNKLPHMKPDSAFPWDAKYDGSSKNPGQLAKQLAEAIQSAKDSGKPFFINCNIGDPHRPFYGAGPKNPQKAARAKNEGEGIVAKPFTAEDVKAPRFLENLPDIREEYAQYSNSVQRLDISFGNVIDELRKSGLADKTIVVFLSDHGISMPFSKATVYFNGTWSPVLIKVPGKDGAEHPELVSSTDILPTLLELSGNPVPEGIDGRSWIPLLNGEKQSGRDRVFTHVNGVSSGKQFPQRAVNTLTRSLIFLPWAGKGQDFRVEAMQGLAYAALAEAAAADPAVKPRVEQFLHGVPLALYDLEKDPDQRTNVIDDPAYASDRRELEQSLLSHMEKTGDPQLAAFRDLLSTKP